MKTYLLIIIISLAVGLLGTFIGYKIGSNQNISEGNEKIDSTNEDPLGEIKSKENISEISKSYSYEELKKLVLEKEKDRYLKLLDISGSIQTRKEGPMFNKEYVQYFECDIINDALLLAVKDIKVQIDYISYTDTKIKRETITIFEYIFPNSYTDFSEKVDPPESFKEIKCKVLSATVTNMTREQYYSE